jgi:hypothetical protein
MLPLMLSMVVASITNGFAVHKIGYYTPSAIIGSCIMAIGAGLLTTLQVNSPTGHWVGYQILYGFGMGMCFQAPNLAAQTVLPTRDVPIGTSLMFFMQLLGASIFIPVGQYVLLTQLGHKLAGIGGLDLEAISSSGATSLSTSVPEHLRETVLLAYNAALRDVFRLGLAITCLIVLGIAGLEFKSVKKEAQASKDAAGKLEAEGVSREKK